MANVALEKKVEEKINNANVVTDGIITGYTGSKGFAYFPWPGTLTVDLGEVYTLKCIRILFWDGLGKKGTVRDPRVYKYRLLTSTDHRVWKVLIDTGHEGFNGWQVFTFPDGLDTRYVRIHGIWNSAKPQIHIVQVEAHDTEAPELDAEFVLKRNILTDDIFEETGDGLPLTSRVRDIINNLENLIESNVYLNPVPFKSLITDLRSQVKNIGAIELSMDAIRSEITEPVNQELKKSSKLGRFSVWGFWVGIVGGTLAIISLVVVLLGIDKGGNEGLVRLLKNQNSALQAEANQLRNEVSNLRVELISQERKIELTKTETPQTGKPEISSDKDIFAERKSAPGYVDITLERGMTKVIFQDELYIGLVATDYLGKPLRHKVWFNVSGKDKELKVLDELDVGSVVEYHDFEIRILSASSSRATFRVRQSQKSSRPNESMQRTQ